MKILLIESDQTDAALISALLEKVFQGDADILPAGSVDEMDDALQGAQADVILLGLQSSDDPWRDALARLTEKQPQASVIVLATEDNDQLAGDVFDAGAVEYLLKGQLTIGWMRRAINYAIHRKHLFESTRKPLKQLVGIINLSADAIVSIDAEHCITLFNLAAEEMFGYTAFEVLGLPLGILLPEQYRAIHEEHIESFAKEASAARRMNERKELTGMRRNGEMFPAEISISKLLSPEGVVFTAIIRDITDRKRVYEQMHNMAMTDPLTGIANRRRFLDIVELELQRSRRYHHPLSLLLIDIDRFKDVNDTYGHAIGDQTLRSVTSAFHELMRDNDMVARIGGDEFVILLPETDEKFARILAQRLCDHIAKVDIPCNEEHIGITVCIGCGMVKDEDKSIEEALERADQAMLESKRMGRNRVL
ncbi:MAG: diguanylate cyclase [Sideroxyarcus sp.]|nr:diguanylate cyclase [Sideroxyarcus sp.]